MSATRLCNLRVPIIHRTTGLQAIGSRRAFHSCRVLAKESDLHNENKAEKLESDKQDSIEKQKQQRGEWSDSLSSDSESVIKADRGEIKDSKATIKELQEESARAAEKEKKEKGEK